MRQLCFLLGTAATQYKAVIFSYEMSVNIIDLLHKLKFVLLNESFWYVFVLVPQ